MATAKILAIIGCTYDYIKGMVVNIPLERKSIREDPRVGGYVENMIEHRLHDVTAYGCVLSDVFSLRWDLMSNAV